MCAACGVVGFQNENHQFNQYYILFTIQHIYRSIAIFKRNNYYWMDYWRAALIQSTADEMVRKTDWFIQLNWKTKMRSLMLHNPIQTEASVVGATLTYKLINSIQIRHIFYMENLPSSHFQTFDKFFNFPNLNISISWCFFSRHFESFVYLIDLRNKIWLLWPIGCSVTMRIFFFVTHTK